MSATSASSGSSARAWRTTRSRSAATATETRGHRRAHGPRLLRPTRSWARWSGSSTPISTCGRARRRRSSKPSAAWAWSRSRPCFTPRRLKMRLETQFRPLDRTVGELNRAYAGARPGRGAGACAVRSSGERRHRVVLRGGVGRCCSICSHRWTGRRRSCSSTPRCCFPRRWPISARWRRRWG